jgi:hypothetical protein
MWLTARPGPRSLAPRVRQGRAPLGCVRPRGRRGQVPRDARRADRGEGHRRDARAPARAVRRARGRDALQPGAHEPGGERDQVHAGRQGDRALRRRARARARRRRGLQQRRPRHGHRHGAARGRRAVRALRAAEHAHRARLRRLRPRSAHLARARPPPRRRVRRREREGQGHVHALLRPHACRPGRRGGPLARRAQRAPRGGGGGRGPAPARGVAAPSAGAGARARGPEPGLGHVHATARDTAARARQVLARAHRRGVFSVYSPTRCRG